jgi:predicted permease
VSRLAAAVIIWVAARLVPSGMRARWREEWRGEMDAAASRGRGMMLRLAFGLPADALACRASTTRTRSGRGPWQTDAKQTLRALARSPWHVVTVSLCLGIGIAVSVTVFSILSSILTGDLPGVQDRGRLMRLYLRTDEASGPSSPGGASVDDYAVLKEGGPGIPAIAAEGRWEFAVRTPAGTLAVDGAFVSGNYFGVLGTQPALGRLLTPADDRAGAPPAAVLSHAFWTATLGAPAGIIGSTIVVGRQEVLVAGIAPEHFSGTDVGDLGEPPGLRYKIYLPLSMSPVLAPALRADERWLTVIGRATADRSHDALGAGLQPLAARIETAHPATRRNAGILVTKSGMGPRETMAVVALIITLMMSAPLTVLAIGCANVANLQLVRASLRARELAIRLSIGATRGQLVRLLIFESVFLAVLACAAGVFGTRLLLRLAALVIPFHVGIDWPVVGFVVTISVVVVMATGLVPAWLATRHSQALSLTGGSRSTSPAGSRVRRGLVVAQVALCLLLLLTAALFTRSLDALAGRVPAVAHDVVVAEVRFDTLGYSQPQRAAFAAALQERLRSDPRVQAVGLNSIAPLRHGERRFWLPGDSDDRLRAAHSWEVTPDWFEAAGLDMRRGRAFTTDEAQHGNAAIVDQGFIDKYRLVEPVLGTPLRLDRPIPAGREARSINDRPGSAVRTVTIVGVVSNAMARPIIPETPASLYLPLGDVPTYVAAYVRSSQPRDMLTQVRQTMAAIDRDLPAIGVSTLADRYTEDAGDIRLLAEAAAGLGGAALLLAVAGVYSVVAFFVSLRTHEFGIRLAIGARPRDIIGMVVRQASRLVLVGLIAGLVPGVPVLLFLGKAFPYASPFDPIGLLGPAAVLALTALAAASLPARRAAQVDPCTALRSE